MANNIKDNQIWNTTNKLLESIPNEQHNPYGKIKPNCKDSHFIRRNNRSNKNVDVEGRLKVYHQNIRGLRGKVNELLLALLKEAPHIICLNRTSSERRRN